MEREKEAFDNAGFLDLMDEVRKREVIPDNSTGVVSVRIHVRDGMPWAVSVQFEEAREKAA
jgi:hypothetical protein